MAIINQKVRIFIIDWRGLYSGIQKDEFFRETLDEVDKVARDDDLEFIKA